MSWKPVLAALRHITVEPLVFLNLLALSSLAVTEHTLLYRIVCVQNFPEFKLECDDLRNDPILEDKVQRIASTWTIFLSLSYVLPAILAQNFLGAFSDKYGRKFNILLGFGGLIVTTVPDLVLLAFPNTPLYVLVVSNVLTGFTGYTATIAISCLALLADTVQDERALTFRMTIVAICKSLGALCGAFAMGALIQRISLAVAVLLSQTVLVLAFFYALWRIPEKSEEVRSQRGVSREPKPDLIPATDHSLGSRWKSMRSSICRVVRMNQEVVMTLVKKRPYHRRAYVVLCTLTFFCYTMSELGLQHGPLMSLYVFRRPFNWSPSQLGTFKGVQHSFSLAGNLLGALLIHKYQNKRFRVTSIVLLALTSGIGFLLLTGLAKHGFQLFIAAGVGSFASLLIPAIKSFMTKQVEPDEVGKALALNGIAADLAFVLTTLVFTEIYNATLCVFAGFVFVLGAAVVAVCLVAVGWMHWDVGKQQRKIEELREKSVAVVNSMSMSDEEMKCFT